jgi:hypothetical protein
LLVSAAAFSEGFEPQAVTTRAPAASSTASLNGPPRRYRVLDRVPSRIGERSDELATMGALLVEVIAVT